MARAAVDGGSNRLTIGKILLSQIVRREFVETLRGCSCWVRVGSCKDDGFNLPGNMNNNVRNASSRSRSKEQK